MLHEIGGLLASEVGRGVGSAHSRGGSCLALVVYRRHEMFMLFGLPMINAFLLAPLFGRHVERANCPDGFGKLSQQCRCQRFALWRR